MGDLPLPQERYPCDNYSCHNEVDPEGDKDMCESCEQKQIEQEAEKARELDLFKSNINFEDFEDIVKSADREVMRRLNSLSWFYFYQKANGNTQANIDTEISNSAIIFLEALMRNQAP